MASRPFTFASNTLRRLAQALLLLAVICQPVMASLGDLHEAAHGTDLHAAASDPHDDAGSAPFGDEGDRDSLLHALMCASHCCGHAVAMPVGLALLPAVAPSRMRPAWPDQGLPTAPLAHPFRPPIAA